MIEFLLGVIGVFFGVLIFVVGIFVGRAGRKEETSKWLEHHGCYLCYEKYKYRNPITGEPS